MGSSVIDFGEWMPDQPALANPGALEAKGVIPAARSYRPMASLASAGTALDGQVLGVVSAKTADAAPQLVAGTATKLWRRIGAVWADSSKDGGYTANEWAGVQYGSLVLMTGYNAPIQMLDVESGPDTAFADLSPSAPRARCIGVIKDFVVVGDTWDDTDGARPNRVWWPASGDPTSWPVPGSSAAAATQSDFNDLATGHRVMAITGAVGGADGMILCESAIWRVQYEGPPTILGFYEVERAKGCIARRSVVNTGALVFYLGEDGFYRSNGAVSEPIGNERVDRWFFSRVDKAKLELVSAAVDVFNKVVVWAFPSVGGNGVPDTLLVYNWAVNRWSWASAECELVFGSYSPGYTLEDLNALGPLDGLPWSLDSAAWVGGRLLLSAFDHSHTFANFAGPNMPAVLDTKERSLGGGRVFVRGVRPLVEGAAATASLLHRSDLVAAPTVIGPRTLGITGVCPFRLDTRYARVRVEIAAGSDWTHATGVEIDAEARGRR